MLIRIKKIIFINLSIIWVFFHRVTIDRHRVDEEMQKFSFIGQWSVDLVRVLLLVARRNPKVMFYSGSPISLVLAKVIALELSLHTLLRGVLWRQIFFKNQ
jgi:hypothetical protein